MACRSVDRGVHRLLERRTSQNKVIAQEAECAVLREYGRVLIDRTIFETEYQMGGYTIAPCILRHLTIGESLAFKGSAPQESHGSGLPCGAQGLFRQIARLAEAWRHRPAE